MKEVNFDLNLAVNPYVGIAVYENELITRLVKKYKDFKYVGTVCFNRENKKGLEKLNIPINTALAPYGMTFNRARTWGIPYNWLSRSFSDIYMFWANSIPAFPIRGKVVSVIHDLTPLYTTKNPEAIQRYRQIIKRCLERSDFIITVSKF